jgi:cell division septation protein DedD
MYRNWLGVLGILFGLTLLIGFDSACHRQAEPDPEPVRFDPLDVETKPDLSATPEEESAPVAHVKKSPKAKPTPEKTSAPKTKKSTTLLPDDKLYTVQVGMFANKENAQKLAKKLGDHGYKVETKEGENKKLGKVWILRLKATTDYETAHNNAAKLKVQEGINAVVTTK